MDSVEKYKEFRDRLGNSDETTRIICALLVIAENINQLKEAIEWEREHNVSRATNLKHERGKG